MIFHLALLAGYTALAFVHTYPLPAGLQSRLPGLVLGDNVTFVWNFWWMREALRSDTVEFFTASTLFAPFGTSLVLHTHTALAAFAGATLLGGLPIVTAQNLIIIASLVLNGVAAYVLTRTVSSSRIAAAIAGALFVVSPPVTARLMGHYNLVLAWALVGACAALLRCWRAPTVWAALATGMCAGALAYVDYYYAVYFVLFALTLVCADLLTVSANVQRRASIAVSRVAAAAAVLAFAAGLLVVLFPVGQIELGTLRITMRTPTNAWSIGWLLAAVAVIGRWRFRIAVHRRTGTMPGRAVPQLALAALIALAVIAPLLTRVWRVVGSGDYVAPAAALKSSAKGVDVATLLLGPPFSGVIGDRVRQIYERLAIDPMESSAWLGVIVFVSVLLSLRRSWVDAELRRWMIIGAVFAVWALGPYLGVFGVNTGVMLPEALAHLVPVINNARIPSRAMVMVDLCACVLAATAMTRVAAARGRTVAALLVCLAIAERLAFPLPVSAIEDPGVYRSIAADRTGGAVLTVPFGVRDGFGERGRLEADALYGQTAHRHPLVGGFVARLPPHVGDWYAATEPFATLLRLSEHGGSSDFPDCATAAAGLARAAVSFVVLYRADASAGLIQFVQAGMPVTMVGADGTRTLFRVSERGCTAR